MEKKTISFTEFLKENNHYDTYMSNATLDDLDGVNNVSPEDWYAGLFTWNLDDFNSDLDDIWVEKVNNNLDAEFEF